MKYGETLRQRSIPAWSHHNIDYDDIKHLIKERTTPGKGKTISVPGRGDDKLRDFENELFAIFVDQHQRINLFVKSKAGEIQRRLGHANKQLKQLRSRHTTTDERIPISRLERYSRLENDVIKVGEEIKSLARFASTQRTAIRKLLKKYKKWTGSTDLEERLHEEVLSSSKSFTKLELGSLLDQYSETLQNIRSLYESRIQQSSSRSKSFSGKDGTQASSSVVSQLQARMKAGSKKDFDTAFATVPLGESGAVAAYFVHPDNVVELQVLLLQHARLFSPEVQTDGSSTPGAPKPNWGLLLADRLERFAQEQSALTVDDREHLAGSTPQKAKFCARWQDDELATISARASGTTFKYGDMKRKHLPALFPTATDDRSRRPSLSAALESKDVAAIQDLVNKDGSVAPLCSLAATRCRFVGLAAPSSSMVLAVLDSNISIQSAEESTDQPDQDFPFAVLWAREEGGGNTELFNMLDKSHLVERVRGFSMEYHAVWQTCKASNMAPPFWQDLLSRDIRKLPPPMMKRTPGGKKEESSGQSTALASNSTSTQSLDGRQESSGTAVDGSRTSTAVVDFSDPPPLRAFRNKRKRTYPSADEDTQTRYWSEYDHPEDADDGANAYVIYIDPNERSALEKMLDRVGRIFSSKRKSSERDALLSDESIPSTPREDESSSDEETSPLNRRTRDSKNRKSYGTNSHKPHTSLESLQPAPAVRLLPQLTTVCMIASAAIMIVAYVLASTGKRKLAHEVDAGVIFAIVSSLVFAIVGVASMLGRQDLAWSAWAIAIGLLVADAICSGGLLAWLLG